MGPGKKSAKAAAQEEQVVPWTKQYLAAYQVSTGTADAKASVTGGELKLKPESEAYFDRLFARNPEKYPIPIQLRPTPAGPDVVKASEVRNSVMALAKGTKAERRKAVKALAKRLAEQTPHQVKDGLFVAMVATRGGVTRLVMWRFTASATFEFKKSGEDEVEITVQLQGFSPGHNAKSVVFEDTEGANSFWKARIKDEQVSESKTDHAKYWVDFLDAVSAQTDERGSRLLGQAARAASKELVKEDDKANLEAVLVAVQTQKKETSMQAIAEQLNEGVREVFLKHAGPPEMHAAPFNLVKKLVRQKVAKRLVIDNEIHIKGSLPAFESKVSRKKSADGKTETITITGLVTTEDLQTLE